MSPTIRLAASGASPLKDRSEVAFDLIDRRDAPQSWHSFASAVRNTLHTRALLPVRFFESVFVVGQKQS